MQFGAIFPEVGVDLSPAGIREYARGLEGLGYESVQAFDRVLGANPNRPGWEGPYDATDVFHEPLVLFGHLAAVTDSLRLVTGVLVLPQRATALVAKQAAEVDVLSEGRLRLGVGVGWNDLEYEALDRPFGARGARIDEQIPLLRRLWTEETVDFDGEFHSVPDSGLNPPPVQRPIPVWIGGGSDAVLERIGRIGDGWLTPRAPLSEVADGLATLRDAAETQGRDPDDVAVIGRVDAAGDGPTAAAPDEWVERTRRWQELGATHLVFETGALDDDDPSAHLERLAAVRDRLSDADLWSP
jgi:probable F420-dependent oxidoreductase